ncbi:MAG: thioredoxin family protein [Victivallaceae bacterium]|nr:thioredoxin family protein [Victivallaceae bacterium]
MKMSLRPLFIINCYFWVKDYLQTRFRSNVVAKFEAVSAFRCHLVRLVGLLLLGLSSYANAFDLTTPFKWQAELKNQQVRVKVAIPAEHYLYFKSTKVSAVNSHGVALKLLEAPLKETHDDPFSGKVDVYQGGKSTSWLFKVAGDAPYTVNVSSQGCRNQTATENAVCFMPEDHTFKLGSDVADNSTIDKGAKPDVAGKLDELFSRLDRFGKRRSASGYLGTDDFMAFMNDKGDSEEESLLSGKSIWLVILLIVLGGLGLNLTPCVLPMIPVNLAIIGAGTGAASKKRGFWLGGAYGIGIALAYGTLGLSVVLAGAQFGALNSTVWFNLTIAIVFLVMALAMFDIFNVDLSRYGVGVGPSDKQRGKVFTAFVMGIIAALLAGACVAPVVIAVLLYSARVYGEGNWLGLTLPFLLGIGMGLPWPFAGAGMAVIPKPGMWMVRIKQFFGVVIILAAGYYGYIAFSLVNFSSGSAGTSSGQIAKLQAAIVEAEARNVPILIDFWATWCKNCSKMEATTFKDSGIKDKLKGFVFVKFQAEKLNDADTAAITNYFKVKGLPTYIILKK